MPNAVALPCCLSHRSQTEGSPPGTQDYNALHAADKVVVGEKFALCRWYTSAGLSTVASENDSACG